MIKRALTVTDIESYEPDMVGFEGEWLASIGNPELTGCWVIWGESFNGKTRFAMMLAKYIATFRKVAYNSLEEGLSASIKKTIREVNMRDVKHNFVLLDKEPMHELRKRLLRQRSPEVVFIDSLQYTGMSYADCTALRDEFRNKLFIFISHADGREPKGTLGKSVRYDSFVKVRVEGFKAFFESRFGGGKPLVIWEQRAHEYWNANK